MPIHPKDDELTPPDTAMQEELASLIERFTGKDGFFPTAIDGLQLGRVSKPLPATYNVYQPSLCIIAQGSKLVFLGSETFQYDPGHFLVASVDLPTFGYVEKAEAGKPHLGLNLRIDPSQLAALALEIGLPETPVQPNSVSGMTVGRMDASLLESLVRLMRLLKAPQDARVLASMVTREIMYRLVAGEQGARLRQIAADNSKVARIARAIEWIKEHYAEPFRIDEVARAAYMSPSGLHHHFKAVTAMSPLQYQKQLRLQEARRLMLGESMDAATASFQVGYESPSQFSREYSRLFGAPPLRDINTLRQSEFAAA